MTRKSFLLRCAGLVAGVVGMGSLTAARGAVQKDSTASTTRPGGLKLRPETRATPFAGEKQTR